MVLDGACWWWFEGRDAQQALEYEDRRKDERTKRGMVRAGQTTGGSGLEIVCLQQEHVCVGRDGRGAIPQLAEASRVACLCQCASDLDHDRLMATAKAMFAKVQSELRAIWREVEHDAWEEHVIGLRLGETSSQVRGP